MSNVAIIQCPGTNCDLDTEYAFKKLGFNPKVVWHTDSSLPDKTDLVVIAGGFSYGDYLRSGAIAQFANIMQSVKEFANKGGYVLGICNGFQILLEMNLLPGAMKRNENLHFISKFHHLKVESNNNQFLRNLENSQIVNIPIAHAEGNYHISHEGLKELYSNEQVLLKYVDSSGNISNPNGSVDSIAGICNKNKNVFGLMPHPERAIEDKLNSSDGAKMLLGFLN
jgi:phosphoribosylformylglycinamidine synthase